MISSETNSQMKELVKLQKNARARRKSKSFVVEGIKITKEAAGYGKLQKVYFSESYFEKYKEEWEEILKTHPYEEVSDNVFKQVADTITPQGVMGVVSMPEYTLDDMLLDEKKLFIMLDDLRDPGNLGTIVRTSEGAGMSGVILSKDSVDLFNPKVVRSTMGAIFRVPFFYADSLCETIDYMKQKGISIYGTMMEGSVVYDQVDYTKPSGIVIGNEANGISKEVMGHLSGRIRIPMGGKLESLNAAVAAAVCMYEAARQRR